MGGLVGVCGARAVSRKTPIYFMVLGIFFGGGDCWWANVKNYEIQDQLVKLAQLVVRSGQGDDDVKSMAMMMTFLVSDGPICGANRAVAQPERTMVRSQIFVQHISRFRRKF